MLLNLNPLRLDYVRLHHLFFLYKPATIIAVNFVVISFSRRQTKPKEFWNLSNSSILSWAFIFFLSPPLEFRFEFSLFSTSARWRSAFKLMAPPIAPFFCFHFPFEMLLSSCADGSVVVVQYSLRLLIIWEREQYLLTHTHTMTMTMCCFAFSLSPMRSTVAAVLTDYPESPVLIHPLRQQRRKQRLKCLAFGHPTPVIHWRINNNESLHQQVGFPTLPHSSCDIVTPPTTCPGKKKKLDDVGDSQGFCRRRRWWDGKRKKKKESQWTFFLVRWSVTESRGDGSDVGKKIFFPSSSSFQKFFESSTHTKMTKDPPHFISFFFYSFRFWFFPYFRKEEGNGGKVDAV